MNKDILLKVKNLSKSFQINHKKEPNLKWYILSFFKRNKSKIEKIKILKIFLLN